MTWIVFALSAALFTGLGDALFKTLLKRDDEYVVIWMRAVFIVPFVLVGFFIFGPFRVTTEFWLLALFVIPVDIFAFIMYLRAIKSSPLSLTLPFLAFTPIFVIINSWLILGEQISQIGLLGILFVVFGSYILNIREVRRGLHAPFRAIISEPGPKLMIIASFLYGLDAVLGKKMMLLSEPKFFALTYPVFLFLVLTPIIYYRVQHKISRFRLSFGRFMMYFLASVFFAIVIVSHFKAVSLGLTAYAISIKRTSILVGSVMGFVVFKERNVLTRLIGIAIMLAGVLLIGFYG